MDTLGQEFITWLVNQGVAVAIAGVLLWRVIGTLEDIHSTLDRLTDRLDSFQVRWDDYLRTHP